VAASWLALVGSSAEILAFALHLLSEMRWRILSWLEVGGRRQARGFEH